MTFESIKNNEAIRTYISQADASLCALGYTEHSFAHVTHVANTAGNILETLGYDTRTAELAGQLLEAFGYSEREVELAKIAGFMHDIGNLVNRVEHSQSGAVMAFRILDKLGMPPEEISEVVTAIGNHDEGTGVPVSPLAAALILADKSDVRKTRVRCDDTYLDIHDRVNYSVESSVLRVDTTKSFIILELTVNTELCAIMDYFEIFLERMLLCRKAAETLGSRFTLIINGQQLL